MANNDSLDIQQNAKQSKGSQDTFASNEIEHGLVQDQITGSKSCSYESRPTEEHFDTNCTGLGIMNDVIDPRLMNFVQSYTSTSIATQTEAEAFSTLELLVIGIDLINEAKDLHAQLLEECDGAAGAMDLEEQDRWKLAACYGFEFEWRLRDMCRTILEDHA